MRVIDEVVVHCADTPNGNNKFTVKDIDDWHRARKFTRREADRIKFNPELTSIGYHFVIYCDGTEHTGRDISEIGAHCIPNGRNIGICLFGRNKFTPAQWETLKIRLTKLKEMFPGLKIRGHYEHDSAKVQGKTCPNFDVPSYVADGFVPDDKNLV